MPPDNPFVGKAGARPEIFTVGHRDHFGIAPHPTTGQIFHAELGPLGGDKINILTPGGNYGWPTYGYGRENDGSPMQHPNREGIEPAWITWNPGITPSGLIFYTGDKFPQWKGNIFVGSIQRGRDPWHRRARARRLQREAVGAASRNDPAGSPSAHPRRPARAGRPDLPAHGGRRWRGDQDRAGELRRLAASSRALESASQSPLVGAGLQTRPGVGSKDATLRTISQRGLRLLPGCLEAGA